MIMVKDSKEKTVFSGQRKKKNTLFPHYSVSATGFARKSLNCLHFIGSPLKANSHTVESLLFQHTSVEGIRSSFIKLRVSGCQCSRGACNNFSECIETLKTSKSSVMVYLRHEVSAVKANMGSKPARVLDGNS